MIHINEWLYRNLENFVTNVVATSIDGAEKLAIYTAFYNGWFPAMCSNWKHNSYVVVMCGDLVLFHVFG